MANQAQLGQYLLDSLLLDSPVISADPTFYQIKSGIGLVIEQSVKVTGYSVSTLPIELEEYVILLCKKEIYFRLATLTAPEYNMETEFSKLLKGDRWEHYYKLLEITIKELKRLDDDGILSTITTGEVIISGRNSSFRNYRLAQEFEGSLTLSNITSNSVEMTWDEFNRSDFSGYEILIGTESFYDEYADVTIDMSKVKTIISVTDVHRVKYRVTGLLANQIYYVLLRYIHTNGFVDLLPISFSTLE